MSTKTLAQITRCNSSNARANAFEVCTTSAKILHNENAMSRPLQTMLAQTFKKIARLLAQKILSLHLFASTLRTIAQRSNPLCNTHALEIAQQFEKQTRRLHTGLYVKPFELLIFKNFTAPTRADFRLKVESTNNERLERLHCDVGFIKTTIENAANQISHKEVKTNQLKIASDKACTSAYFLNRHSASRWPEARPTHSKFASYLAHMELLRAAHFLDGTRLFNHSLSMNVN